MNLSIVCEEWALGRVARKRPCLVPPRVKSLLPGHRETFLVGEFRHARRLVHPACVAERETSHVCVGKLFPQPGNASLLSCPRRADVVNHHNTLGLTRRHLSVALPFSRLLRRCQSLIRLFRQLPRVQCSRLQLPGFDPRHALG